MVSDLVRAETDRDIFHSLRGSRDKLPLRHRVGRALGQDGVASNYIHIAHFSIRSNRNLQTNQASDLSMLQQFRVFRLYRDQHFAIGFCGFLGQRSRRESAQEAERQNRRGRDSVKASGGLGSETIEQDGSTTNLRTDSTPSTFRTLGHESVGNKITKVPCVLFVLCRSGQRIDQIRPRRTAPSRHQVISRHRRVLSVAAANDVVEVAVITRSHANRVQSRIQEPKG